MASESLRPWRFDRWVSRRSALRKYAWLKRPVRPSVTAERAVLS